MRSAARLRTIIDTGATVLCCTPTYAHPSGGGRRRREDRSGGREDRERIIVAGEPGGSIPATRAHIEKLWPGARVVDHHGMTETGPVSYGCPQRPGVLHVIESAYIAEVIDPESGQAVPPGGTGELVLTNLGRMGSPLLRYRTGDLVRARRRTRRLRVRQLRPGARGRHSGTHRRHGGGARRQRVSERGRGHPARLRRGANTAWRFAPRARSRS